MQQEIIVKGRRKISERNVTMNFEEENWIQHT